MGRGVAEALLRQGASVVIAARSGEQVAEAKEELARLGPADGMACDVTDAGAVDALCKHTVDTFGRLDIAVCCQGVYGNLHPILDYPEEEWDAVVAINLKGSFLLARAAARAMVAVRHRRRTHRPDLVG